MKFVKLEFASGGFRPASSDYDRSLNKAKISETGGRELHEQREYTNCEFGGERKTRNGYALIRGKRYEEEKIWVGKVLLLLSCVGRIESAMKWHFYIL